jgi:hypothetical protein
MFYLMQFCTLPRVKNLPIFLGAGDFPSKNVGAERSDGGQISENLIFLVFYMFFSRKNAQEGPKCSTITPEDQARYSGIFLKKINCRT